MLVTSLHSRRVVILHYGLAADRVRVVPEGIDLGEWELLPEPESRAGSVVLSVGRQYRRKNTHTLLEAFARVRRGLAGVSLRIVGDGPELPALKRHSAALGLDDVVLFLGPLESRKRILTEYASADLFCLPSRQEGFGIVFLEAMAARLPIVAADAAAIPEVAPHDEVALLVPPDDADALAAAILRVLRDRTLAQRLSSAGRARCRAYDWSAVAARFIAEALA